jgi:prephenate dehydrogenase
MISTGCQASSEQHQHASSAISHLQHLYALAVSHVTRPNPVSKKITS